MYTDKGSATGGGDMYTDKGSATGGGGVVPYDLAKTFVCLLAQGLVMYNGDTPTP